MDVWVYSFLIAAVTNYHKLSGSVEDTFLFFLIFWPHHAACGILVPRPGIEPTPPAVEARSPNHWTAREAPRRHNSKKNFFY